LFLCNNLIVVVDQLSRWSVHQTVSNSAFYPFKCF
ncbi:hypothetical protein D043_0691B, partial [Vibrio parahaemolyticus EKP-021]